MKIFFCFFNWKTCLFVIRILPTLIAKINTYCVPNETNIYLDLNIDYPAFNFSKDFLVGLFSLMKTQILKNFKIWNNTKRNVLRTKPFLTYGEGIFKLFHMHVKGRTRVI